MTQILLTAIKIFAILAFALFGMLITGAERAYSMLRQQLRHTAEAAKQFAYDFAEAFGEVKKQLAISG
jgi:hypothetical protein